MWRGKSRWDEAERAQLDVIALTGSDEALTDNHSTSDCIEDVMQLNPRIRDCDPFGSASLLIGKILITLRQQGWPRAQLADFAGRL